MECLVPDVKDHDIAGFDQPKCPLAECGRSFSSWTSLREHLVEVHKKSKAEVQELVTLRLAKQQQENKTILCPQHGCESRFEFPVKVRRHLTTKHDMSEGEAEGMEVI